jgi:hypothetical protein
LEIVTRWEQRDEELAADLFSVGYPAVSQERALERASVWRTLVFCAAWSARPKMSILAISRRRPKFRPSRTGRIVFRGVNRTQASTSRSARRNRSTRTRITSMAK